MTTQLHPAAHPETKLAITPIQLSITETFDSGGTHNVHLIHNDDLADLLDGAAEARPGGDVPPHNHEAVGVVVISLGADDDHDEVHYDGGCVHDPEELIGQAMEALANCQLAMRRVRLAGSADAPR